MPRPLVAVFQEYASLSLATPEQADLNTCVVGVAKQVMDFNAAKPSETRSASGTFPAVQIFAPAGMAPGAVLETASVYFAKPEVIVSSGAQVSMDVSDPDVHYNLLFDKIISDYATVGSIPYESVSAGHYVYVRDDTGTWYPLGAIQGVKAPATSGDKYTVTLRKAVPDAYPDGTASGKNLRTLLATAAPGEVRVTKSLESSVQVSAAYVYPDSSANTVKLDAIATVVDEGYSVKVHHAPSVCIAYVARRSDLAFIDVVRDAAEIETKLGKIDARNPLALAASLALKNAGAKIFVYGVPEDTEAAYGAFQRAAMPRSDIYCIVPVCLDPLTQRAVVDNMSSKVKAMADADTALASGVPQRFKMIVAGGFPAVQDPRKLYTFPKGGTPDAANIQVTPLGGNKYRVLYPAATFADSGVLVGDSVTSDPNKWFGSGVYTVEEVVSNSAIVISAPSLPTFNSADYCIVRKLKEDEIRDGLAAVPKGVASRRVVMLLGDSVVIRAVAGETKLSAAYLGCAVGGMIAGLPPHAGLTNLYVAGIDDVVGTGDFFSEENLSILSDAGWCVFVEDVPDATPYCIHGVTTDPSAIEFQEIMSVKNFDYVSASLSNALGQFLGTWNINNETLGYINASLDAVLTRLKSSTVPKLGAPLIAGQIDSLAQHPDQKDRVEIYASLTMPKSLNTIGLHLVSA